MVCEPSQFEKHEELLPLQPPMVVSSFETLCDGGTVHFFKSHVPSMITSNGELSNGLVGCSKAIAKTSTASFESRISSIVMEVIQKYLLLYVHLFCIRLKSITCSGYGGSIR